MSENTRWGEQQMRGDEGRTYPTRTRGTDGGFAKGDAVRVVHTTAGGYEQYNGFIVGEPADVAIADNLTTDTVGANGVACIIRNLWEIGQATNVLTDAANTYQKYWIGVIAHINADGTPVVDITGEFVGCTGSGTSAAAMDGW